MRVSSDFSCPSRRADVLSCSQSDTAISIHSAVSAARIRTASKRCTSACPCCISPVPRSFHHPTLWLPPFPLPPCSLQHVPPTPRTTPSSSGSNQAVKAIRCVVARKTSPTALECTTLPALLHIHPQQLDSVRRTQLSRQGLQPSMTGFSSSTPALPSTFTSSTASQSLHTRCTSASTRAVTLALRSTPPSRPPRGPSAVCPFSHSLFSAD